MTTGTTVAYCYVNQIPPMDSTYHEVHRDRCYRLTQINRKQCLGQSYRHEPAVADAKKTYPKANATAFPSEAARRC